ncbi:molybdopterin-dependent oxidoreductase [Oceanospirillum sediminis]|uniref:Molybdopterin-dependent oxidoreductase n=1 Tax=Oceanospirillum sediminis TaxID=2760088 RepID=A0A839IVS2_9GAMM|nr:molybdopterin-dependent oxidoreductase [Oceanospirillum sediminis]MBB1489455.1 molybdopterin-dependent oxidoreductase [Oceanospirillum sediminis]
MSRKLRARVHNTKRAIILITVMLGTLIIKPAFAEKVILSLQGEGVRSPIHLSMDKLKSLPSVTVNTETIWTNQTHEYKGILLSTLLEKASAKGSTLSMTALNDYTIEVPIETLTRHKAFIAYEQDGMEMKIRNKGPLWLLYPFSDIPEINTPFYQSHSIWQLRKIRVR